MPDFTFTLDEAQRGRSAASPSVTLKLRIVNVNREESIHRVLLRCQLQIDAPRRRYKSGEHERLYELFGEPHRWGQTLRSLPWTNTSVVVPPFTGEARVDIELPCNSDLNTAITKYFAALEDGEVPVVALFSGTVFYKAENGALQIAPIPWEREAHYRLPVRIWRDVMDVHFPNAAWLSLRRDIFDRLCEHKRRRGIASWDDAIAQLLSAAEAVSAAEHE